MKSVKMCLFVFYCAFLAALVFCSCAKSVKAVAPPNNKLKVSVTFNALAEMARAVGGEYAEILTIIPDGMEVHDFELRVQDMKALGGADILVYNGFGLETWVPEAITASGNEKLIAMDTSKGAEQIGTDPHLWLSVKGAQIQTRNIANAFALVDPAHAAMFTKNADAFNADLDALYAEYAKKIDAAPSKIIVTGHAAFGYLCRDFGLTQNSVEDVFATGEPSPQQLASLIEFARTKKVKTIFAEKMVSPAISQTLAAEIGAKVVAIYTMESAEDDKSYIERMRYNLEAIYQSLIE